MSTDIDVYQPGNGQLDQAHLAMTPAQAMALDEQVRRCTEAVLREGIDYGVIPGTNGEKTLWRPGAQKLLQWFRLECICERTEVERDDDGRKHGITYRAEVGRGLKTAAPVILATCEGTADYDESKFYQSAEEVQRKAEASERRWAKKDGRVADPTKWKNRSEWRADWNALMKRAQKRAIVGAVVDATAAGGIFTGREEDDHAPVAEDDGLTWYEATLDVVHTFTDLEDGRSLYVQAAEAHRSGRITRRQQDHLQNTIKQRVKKLQAATVVVEAEDLAAKAEAEHAHDAAEDTQEPADDTQEPADDTAPADDTLPVEDPPDWPEVTRPGTGKPKGK